MTPRPFEIRSSDPANALRFEPIETHHWHAFLECRGLSAQARVWMGQGWATTLDDLLREMAAEWRGWKGEKTWGSDEGEIAISATPDGLGHIKLRVSIGEYGLDDEWSARATLMLDAGALDNLLAEVVGATRTD